MMTEQEIYIVYYKGKYLIRCASKSAAYGFCEKKAVEIIPPRYIGQEPKDEIVPFEIKTLRKNGVEVSVENEIYSVVLKR